MSSPRPRILLVDQTPDVWGGQAILAAAAGSYRDEGWDVTVLAPGGGDLEALLRGEHGPELDFRTLEMPPFTEGRKTPVDVLRLLRLSTRFRQHRELVGSHDLVHVNGPRLWFPVHRVLGGGPGPGLLLHVHLDHSGPEKRLLGRILRLRPRARALAVSSFVRRRLLERIGSPCGVRVLELENALSRPAPAFEDRFAGEALRRAAVPGRIGREKGQALLVEAARRLPELEVLVIGSAAPGQEELDAGLRREAPSNVRFLGRVDDLPATLARERVQAVVVPSAWEEPFGLVAIEAMASSCLTLVRSRGGLVDIARRTGALAFGSGADLERELRGLMAGDPAQLAALAAAQHEATAREYAPDRWRRRLLEIARDRLAPSRTRRDEEA